ncbi:hypothetical protein, partial [Nocardia sp. NPDC004722]
MDVKDQQTPGEQNDADQPKPNRKPPKRPTRAQSLLAPEPGRSKEELEAARSTLVERCSQLGLRLKDNSTESPNRWSGLKFSLTLSNGSVDFDILIPARNSFAIDNITSELDTDVSLLSQFAGLAWIDSGRAEILIEDSRFSPSQDGYYNALPKPLRDNGRRILRAEPITLTASDTSSGLTMEISPASDLLLAVHKSRPRSMGEYLDGLPSPELTLKISGISVHDRSSFEDLLHKLALSLSFGRFTQLLQPESVIA